MQYVNKLLFDVKRHPTREQSSYVQRIDQGIGGNVDIERDMGHQTW